MAACCTFWTGANKGRREDKGFLAGWCINCTRKCVPECVAYNSTPFFTQNCMTARLHEKNDTSVIFDRELGIGKMIQRSNFLSTLLILVTFVRLRVYICIKEIGISPLLRRVTAGLEHVSRSLETLLSNQNGQSIDFSVYIEVTSLPLLRYGTETQSPTVTSELPLGNSDSVASAELQLTKLRLLSCSSVN